MRKLINEERKRMEEKELKKKRLKEEKNKKEPDIVSLMKDDLLTSASEAVLDPKMTNDSVAYSKKDKEVKTIVERVDEHDGVGKVEINIDDKSPNKIKQIQKELLKNIKEVDNEITELKILQEMADNKGRLKFAYAKLELLKERTNCLEILYKIINDNPDVLDDSGFKDMIDFISQTRGQ